MPPKSIFRQPGAKHFQLVHRSQRDPLIHDPDASKHVLKPFERENVKKGKSRADLESILPASDLTHDQEAQVGEAALYGIYYDDTEYNYMQHLRPVGLQEDGVESVLIEAPSTSSQPKPNKGKSSISLRDLPQGVLASTSELPRTYESQQAIPESIAGFQPDMDPHLRQALEALEDEAFVDDGLEDDFFGELVADGERGSDDDIMFEFEEDGFVENGETGKDTGEGEGMDDEQGWEARFKEFKKNQKGTEGRGSENDSGSEGGDTVGLLPEMSVIGGKGRRRRKGTSDASGYSMSSSSMYRNEALQTLDERFDQMIIKEYNEGEDEDEDEEVDEDESDLSNNSDEAPELITTREDFESMMDDFLDNYEILGRKIKPKLAGDSGAEKLNTLRRALGQDERVRIGNEGDDDGDDRDILMQFEVEDKKGRWDCETILTTYSNLENHPRLIRARDPKPVPKIYLDPRTGLPSVVDENHLKPNKIKSRGRVEMISEDDENDSDDEDRPRSQTIARPRDESKEEKKARKQAVKAERQARRVDKKATKAQFGAELKMQMKAVVNKEKVKMKKL